MIFVLSVIQILYLTQIYWNHPVEHSLILQMRKNMRVTKDTIKSNLAISFFTKCLILYKKSNAQWKTGKFKPVR